MSEKCQKLEKIQVRSMGVRRNFSKGQARYFAYPLYVADDTIQMHVHKTLCSFHTITKMPPATDGHNEGARGGTIPRAPNHYGGAMKSQQCPKDLRFKHRGAKPAYCPGRHLTSLRPFCYCSSRKNRASLAQQCFFFIHASFHTAQYKTTKLTTISSHCLAAFSAKDVCVQQSHAAKRLRP